VRSSDSYTPLLRPVFDRLSDKNGWTTTFGCDSAKVTERLSSLYDNGLGFFFLGKDEPYKELLNIGIEIGYLLAQQARVLVFLTPGTTATYVPLRTFSLQHGIHFFSTFWLTNDHLYETIEKVTEMVDAAVSVSQYQDILGAYQSDRELVELWEDPSPPITPGPAPKNGRRKLRLVGGADGNDECFGGADPPTPDD